MSSVMLSICHTVSKYSSCGGKRVPPLQMPIGTEKLLRALPKVTAGTRSCRSWAFCRHPNVVFLSLGCDMVSRRLALGKHFEILLREAFRVQNASCMGAGQGFCL